MTKQERLLRLFLRVIGSAALLAVFFVFMPYSWLNAVHKGLGMEDLPDERVVGYLVRSTSAFYALSGGLFWVLSFDLRRYRLALCYVGAATLFLGLVLFGVDMFEGMPLWWCFVEGPVDAAFGIMILCLACRVGRRSE